MAGSDTGTVVSVKVLVEQNVVLPIRIGLELLRAAVNRPVTLRLTIGAATFAAQEGADDPPADLAGLRRGSVVRSQASI